MFFSRAGMSNVTNESWKASEMGFDNTEEFELLADDQINFQKFRVARNATENFTDIETVLKAKSGNQL